ncbi:hypothetical protein, partial [Streptomyces clavuligerus]
MGSIRGLLPGTAAGRTSWRAARTGGAVRAADTGLSAEARAAEGARAGATGAGLPEPGLLGPGCRSQGYWGRATG